MSRWKIRQNMRKRLEERIAVLREGLCKTRQMAGEFLDTRDFKSLASMHLTIEQDVAEIAGLEEKVLLLEDDAYFEGLLREQAEEGVENDWQDGQIGHDR